MNTLQHYIEAHRLNEAEVMNILQDHGVISDNCVSAADVAGSGKAVSYLNTLPPDEQPTQYHT